jgi:hypothetical protein
MDFLMAGGLYTLQGYQQHASISCDDWHSLALTLFKDHQNIAGHSW